MRSSLWGRDVALGNRMYPATYKDRVIYLMELTSMRAGSKHATATGLGDRENASFSPESTRSGMLA